MFQLEGWDVGAADDFIRGVHVARRAMGLGVPDLYLKEILGRSVDLLEGLLSRLRDSLHFEEFSLARLVVTEPGEPGRWGGIAGKSGLSVLRNAVAELIYDCWSAETTVCGLNTNHRNI